MRKRVLYKCERKINFVFVLAGWLAQRLVLVCLLACCSVGAATCLPASPVRVYYKYLYTNSARTSRTTRAKLKPLAHRFLLGVAGALRARRRMCLRCCGECKAARCLDGEHQPCSGVFVCTNTHSATPANSASATRRKSIAS